MWRTRWVECMECLQNEWQKIERCLDAKSKQQRPAAKLKNGKKSTMNLLSPALLIIFIDRYWRCGECESVKACWSIDVSRRVQDSRVCLPGQFQRNDENRLTKALCVASRCAYDVIGDGGERKCGSCRVCDVKGISRCGKQMRGWMLWCVQAYTAATGGEGVQVCK